jgi:hypothetical protein
MIGDHSLKSLVTSKASESEEHKWDEKGGSLPISSLRWPNVVKSRAVESIQPHGRYKSVTLIGAIYVNANTTPDRVKGAEFVRLHRHVAAYHQDVATRMQELYQRQS